MLDRLTQELSDNGELFDMSKEEGDEAGLTSIAGDAAALQADIEKLEFRRMFNHPMPIRSTPASWISTPGSGGTEAQDWASMMTAPCMCKLRRAQRLHSRGLGGRVSGRCRRVIKSATHSKSIGDYAFGLHAHRDRRAPFGAQVPLRLGNAKRHTSFASAFLFTPRSTTQSRSTSTQLGCAHRHLPRLRRRSGKHINKTDSAVRLTHGPTGIVVQCQDGRSQHSNRDVAWKRLRSRLYDHEMRKRQEEQQKLEDSKTDVGWGHQIRSYVLDNSRIKDLRTGVEISATQKVLDGDLDPFIEASLKQGV